MNSLKKIFLNDKIITAVIVLYAIVTFLLESNYKDNALVFLDITCTLFFAVEMAVKLLEYGWHDYWHDPWNKLDGLLVVLSIPTIVMLFVDLDMYDLSILLVLRLFRVVRFFRLFHFIRNIDKLWRGLIRAIHQSSAVILLFLLLVLIFGLINCSLYKNVVPQYFGSPLESVYTVFRIITVEGWYEIPDSINMATSPGIAALSRLYFCLQLFCIGILGLSLINSVFVDAMVEDNNDDVKRQLREIERKLDELMKKQEADKI